MNDCTNIEIREQLPEFMHGTIEMSAQLRVQRHLETCAACTEELALMQAIRASGRGYGETMFPDVRSIVSAIPSYTSDSAEFTAPQRQRTFGQPFRLAAAFLVAAVGISALAISRQSSSPDVVPSNPVASSHVSSGESLGVRSATVPATGVSLVSVEALSDDQLFELIDEVKTLDLDAAEMVEPLELDLGLRTALSDSEDI